MTTSPEAFSLVQDLAAELSNGEIQLPSLPRTVLRLRAELAKPDFDVGQLARLASTEPALAGSILTMANSVVFRRHSKETFDLQVAIPRIGAGKVQMLAVRFALHQLRSSQDLENVRHLLEPEWALGLRVAASCHLVAEKSRGANPDEAMIVGLIHNIGRIYLYSRAHNYPDLFNSAEALQELVDHWHANVARAIVESWGLPAEAAEAVGRQDDDEDGPPCGMVTDVLRVGLAVTALEDDPMPAELERLAQLRSCRSLKLGAGALAAIAVAREEARINLGLMD